MEYEQKETKLTKEDGFQSSLPSRLLFKARSRRVPAF
jgi:hypothetical protein